MATGDIKDTAKEIAIKLDLLNIESAEKNCISGTEFESMEKSAQLLLLSNFLQEKSGLVFYRLEPKHKQLLITLLSSLDQVVAMTGDGVNDAPALKQADIGIAMGRSGTEVAKEASDMILSDDNFNSIVKAIEEGRSIYNNMKAFIRYMISSNIGEVVCIFIGSVLGIPDIFSSVQLLWVNLVTDGLPAMALSFNPTDNDIMIRPPRKKTEPIVTLFVFIRYLIVGFYVGIATVGVFLYWFLAYDWCDYKHSIIEFGQLNSWSKCNEWEGFMVNDEGDFGDNFCGFFNFGKKKASTLSLTVLVTIEMFNALNALSEYNSILDVGIFSNIWLIFAISISMMMHCGILYINIFQTIFQTEPLSFFDWMIVIGFSAPVIFIDEIVKWHARNKLKGAQHINCCKIE